MNDVNQSRQLIPETNIVIPDSRLVHNPTLPPSHICRPTHYVAVTVSNTPR